MITKTNIFKARRLMTVIAALAAIAVVCGGSKRDASLRLLYWNIQNGMWSDQPNNYDNFVEWVKKYDPDVCVWCEAQTIYEDGTSKACKADDRYLTENWGELAARYGHKYWTKSGHRDNYPQVITSKYPIEKILDIVGEEPDSVVTHGACRAAIKVGGKRVNIVTLHTWPQAYAYRAADREASKAEHGGDKYRRMEMEYICNHTILAEPKAAKEYWMMMGDFNSRSPKDNWFYKYDEGDSQLIVHDYILRNTPYVDIIGDRFAGEFHSTTYGKARIDFVYCTPKLYKRIDDARVVTDDYTRAPERDKNTGFHHPSDHLPILVDFNMK